MDVSDKHRVLAQSLLQQHDVFSQAGNLFSGIASDASYQQILPMPGTSLPTTPLKAYDSNLSASTLSSPSISSSSGSMAAAVAGRQGLFPGLDSQQQLFGSDAVPLLRTALSGQRHSSMPSSGPAHHQAQLNSISSDSVLEQGQLLQLLSDPKVLEAILSTTTTTVQQSPAKRMVSDGYASTDVHSSSGRSESLSVQHSLHEAQRIMSQQPLQQMGVPSVQQSRGMNTNLGVDTLPSVQQLLSSHLLQEFTSTRNVLVQLMLSAYAFLNSESVAVFYDLLTPIAAMYDDMHDLPVVQKRQRCQEMVALRMQLMQNVGFVEVLQALCALRHHLHSLSRKLLVMNQGLDSIPLDLLLGSMSSELYHIMKTVLPQEILDFFGNTLPHPKLAVLVFVEFTSVDPSLNGK